MPLNRPRWPLRSQARRRQGCPPRRIRTRSGIRHRLVLLDRRRVRRQLDPRPRDPTRFKLTITQPDGRLTGVFAVTRRKAPPRSRSPVTWWAASGEMIERSVGARPGPNSAAPRRRRAWTERRVRSGRRQRRGADFRQTPGLAGPKVGHSRRGGIREAGRRDRGQGTASRTDRDQRRLCQHLQPWRRFPPYGCEVFGQGDGRRILNRSVHV